MGEEGVERRAATWVVASRTDPAANSAASEDPLRSVRLRSACVCVRACVRTCVIVSPRARVRTCVSIGRLRGYCV